MKMQRVVIAQKMAELERAALDCLRNYPQTIIHEARTGTPKPDAAPNERLAREYFSEFNKLRRELQERAD